MMDVSIEGVLGRVMSPSGDIEHGAGVAGRAVALAGRDGGIAHHPRAAPRNAEHLYALQAVGRVAGVCHGRVH